MQELQRKPALVKDVEILFVRSRAKRLQQNERPQGTPKYK